MAKPTVGLLKCRDYTPALILSALKRIAEETDFPAVQGKTVLLKPNILSASSPEKAVTTHPEFVRAVIRLIAERGAQRILVGDSPGVGSAEAAGKKTGIKEVVLGEGAEWVVFKETARIQLQGGARQNQFYAAEQLAEADVLISLPKMKTHKMMYYTGAIKNLFGLIPGLKKSRFHLNHPEKEDFAAMIVDLFQALQPDYAFMDGILAMEGPGPGSGYPRRTELVFGSGNLLALDWAAATVMGYSCGEIPILSQALKRGIWLQSPEEIVYPFEAPRDEVIPDFKKIRILKDTGFIKKALPDRIYRLLRDLYIPRPIFSHRKCIRCGECVKICPADALSFIPAGSGKKIRIDYRKCIRCYCCHEICPADAIRVSRV